MSEQQARIADALRRADYMNWSAAEVAERIDGTVDAIRREAQAAGDQALRDLLIDILTNAEYEKSRAEGEAAKYLGLVWDETCGDRFCVPPIGVQPAAAPRETADPWEIVAALPLFPGPDGAAGVTTSIGTAAALRRYRESVLTALHVAVAPAAAASAEPREETK